MKIEVLADSDAVAKAAAAVIAADARAAVAARGRYVFAVSGGTTPWVMLRALAGEDMPWHAVHLLQVDERVAPAGDPIRNLTHLHESLALAPLSKPCIHPMPVEGTDLDAAAARYAQLLREFAGTPPVLDLVHLGMGPDGHTASLVPGDAVLDVTGVDVAITAGPYQGRRRMTLTYQALDRARRVLWLVTGAEKVGMLKRLQAGDRSIPAGRVRADNALVLADRAASPAN